MASKIRTNIIFGFLSWIFPLALTLIVTPTIIHGLGVKEYGIYALVLGFISYSFTFNIGRAVTKYVAEYNAKNETEKINEIFSATFLLSIIVGIIAVLIICSSAKIFARDGLNVDESHLLESVKALYLASAIIFMTMVSQVFNAVIQGIQRFDVYSKLTNLNQFLMLVGNAILVILGYGITILFIWNFLIVSLIAVLYFVSVKKLAPQIKLNFSFRNDSLKTVIKYSSGVIAYQLLGNLFLLFERSWVVRELGEEKLTFYIVPMNFTFYIHGFISSITLMLFPMASELKNNKERLLNIYLTTSKICLIIIAFLCVTGILGSNLFLTNYLGEDFAKNSSNVMEIHFVTFSILALLVVSWQLSEGLGFPKYNAIQSFIWLIVSGILMIILTKNYDILGVAISRLVGISIILFSILFVEKKFFGKSMFGFWIKLASSLLLICGITGLVEYTVFANFPTNWLTFIFGCSIGFVVYFILLFIFGIISENEKQLFKRFYAR
jgi:O-antigen/teichoic acid export membrane protein